MLPNNISCCDHCACSSGRAARSADNGQSRAGFFIRFSIGTAFFVLGLLLHYGIIRLEGTLPLDFAACMISYLLIGGTTLLRSARNIAHGKIFDENFLMSVSTIGAFCIGEYPEAAAVMLFYQIGESLQDTAAGASRSSITRLMDLRPDYANLVCDEGFVRVSPADVLPGSRIAVKPGERIPLDGVIAEGFSSLDCSALTGEAMPVDATVNDTVLSGAINLSGLLIVTVTKTAGDSTAAKILKLVEESAEKKSHVENFITSFARYYTPAVVGAALLIAVLPPLVIGDFQFREWIYKALVFLVVSCPCALVISVPLSFFAGLGAASKNGILIKGSNYLSALAKTETVIFDKTGTLTKGVFSVHAVYPEPEYDEKSLVFYAAGAEAFSNHPAAAAVRAKFAASSDIKQKPCAALIAEYAGMGVVAEVEGKRVLAGNARLFEKEGIPYQVRVDAGTIIYIAVERVFAGALVINDEIKEDAAHAVQELRDLGINKIAMFTGDTAQQAKKTAEAVGIQEVYSELLPHEKAARLEELIKRSAVEKKQRKGSVVFAGDGINDAPSLAISDIGIAMGAAGSDAAIEAADIVLMNDEPRKIARAVNIARRTQHIVLQNIILSLGVKTVILILGVLGIARIWGAVFGDVGVALLAVLNAMRALRGPK